MIKERGEGGNEGKGERKVPRAETAAVHVKWLMGTACRCRTTEPVCLRHAVQKHFADCGDG